MVGTQIFVVGMLTLKAQSMFQLGECVFFLSTYKLKIKIKIRDSVSNGVQCLEFGISVLILTSVQFSCSVISDFLRPCEPQLTRPHCPSQTPGVSSIKTPSPVPSVYSNPCPLSQWCHPTISSSVILFSSPLQSFPTSGSFQMSQFFTSGGQGIGVSASTSVLPVNIQDWSPLRWTGWISGSPRDAQESSPTPQFKSINSSALSFLYSPNLTSIHDYWKNHSFD